MSRGKPDHLKQLAHALPALGTAADVVHRKGLRDARASLPPGVKRRHRILKDHLHLGGPGQGAGDPVQRLPAKQDCAGCRPDEADERASERCLAAAGLADQSDGLGLRQSERDAVYGVHLPDRPAEHRSPRDREVDTQVAGVKKR
jgi:hypothetical protein